MRYLIPALFVALLLGGCGGNNGLPGTATPTPTGVLNVDINWPTRTTRAIPSLANSISIEVTNLIGFDSVQTVNRPTSGTYSTVSFATVPAGTVTVTATAYSGNDKTGTLLASASVSATITQGQTSTVGINMASTITQVVISGYTATTLNKGDTVTLIATPENASGQAVPVASDAITWISDNYKVANVSTAGLVTTVGVGKVDIIATERESGITASVTFTVQSNGTLAVNLLNPTPTLTLSPTTAYVYAGGGQRITPTVGSAPNPYCTWSVQETGGGSVDNLGVYTAPSTAGTYHVTAKAVASSAVTATATVNVYATTLTDLGNLGGTSSIATGINAGGTVVGYSQNTAGNYHAFLWTAAGGIKDLGTLGGLWSYAYGINTAGLVVGAASDAAGYSHAFSYTTAGGMKDLGLLTGYPNSAAYAVNDNGQIVGSVYDATANTGHAMSYTTAGGMTDIGTLTGYTWTQAMGINSAGTIVGIAKNVSASTNHAFSYTAAGGMKDLGTLGGTKVGAAGINTAGQIVGYSNDSSATGHAFLYTTAAGMTDLKSLSFCYDSFANAINTAGQVVGEAYDINANAHAFIYTATGGLMDLGTLTGCVNSYANAINDSSQIVGGADDGAGHYKAFLWKSATIRSAGTRATTPAVVQSVRTRPLTHRAGFFPLR